MSHAASYSLAVNVWQYHSLHCDMCSCCMCWARRHALGACIIPLKVGCFQVAVRSYSWPLERSLAATASLLGRKQSFLGQAIDGSWLAQLSSGWVLFKTDKDGPHALRRLPTCALAVGLGRCRPHSLMCKDDWTASQHGWSFFNLLHVLAPTPLWRLGHEGLTSMNT